MEWVALILSIAAVWSTQVTRGEQARLQKQIDRLKGLLAGERAGRRGSVESQVLDDGFAVKREEQEARGPEGAAAAAELAEEDSVKGEDESLEPSWVEPTPVESPAGDESKTLAQLSSSYTSQSNDEDVESDTAAIDAIKPRTKAKTISFEERLGAGVYVWAGGIALMLAGAFLVKYSFDNDLLTPRARLAIAGAFGVAMVLSSLWVRSRADKVAASLCGAGVAVMYAAVLAATAYFHELGPWVGFGFMIVVTGTAVGMSLLHGSFVALLGLIGGFVTPALINGVESAWGPTFTYLLLLEIGLAVVTRKRQWFGLSALTLLMSILSAVVYAVFAWDTDSRGWLILFVMGTAVVFILNAARGGQEEAKPRSAGQLVWLGIGALGSSALLLSMLVAVSGFSAMELASLGVLAAGAVLLARLDKRYVTLAFLAEGLCGMMLLAWPLAHEFMDAAFEPTRYFQVAAGYGAVFAVGGFLCLWRNAVPGAFAWMSASGALGFVVIAHVGGGRYLHLPWRWWMVYAGVAGVLSVAAGAVWGSRSRHGDRVIDAYALTAAALGTLAIWFGLDHPWVAVAWAGLALVIVALDRGLGLPRLIIATGWLTIGCVVLLIVPGPTGYEMPMRLIGNTMLAHYGVAALCFAGIAWMYRGHGLLWVRAVSQALALVTAVAALTLQVRLGFHREELWAQQAGLIEWTSVVVLWLSVCVCVLRWFATDALEGLNKAATGVGAVGLVASVLYLLVRANPLFMESDLGDWVVLNGLLYAYGLPCVLAGMVAWVLPKEAGVFRQVAGAVSFALLFALVTLEVRHGFVGTGMQWWKSPHVLLNEWATYSVVLVSLSLVMFWIGRWRGLEMLALPAGVMGLAGLFAAVLGPVLIDNPLFNVADVGSMRVLNWLLYVYGLPCVLAAAMAWRVPGELKLLKQIAVGVSLIMLFAFVSFEVRQGFVGPDLMLDAHPIGSAENYSYSLAWVLLALSLLAGGLATGSASLRYGSLAVMLVAVCKVGLDTAQLRDLWRVLSLLGLGLSLIVLGYVYQRYVFRRPATTENGLETAAADVMADQIDE
jgi:uncharacterized membrane protein